MNAKEGKLMDGDVSLDSSPIERRQSGVTLSVDPARTVPANEIHTEDDKEKVFNYVAHVVHEVMNALAAIEGNSACIPAHSENEIPIRHIQSTTKKAAGLLKSLEMMMRSYKGFEMQFVSVSLEEIIEFISYRNRIEIIPHLMVDRIYVDGTYFWSVIENLIINAKKYGEPPFVIESTIEDGNIVIRVIDFGKGFTGNTEEMFDLYKRGPNVQNKKGTGVGLHYCRTIVEKHSGTITAENHDEGGAVFTIKIPNLSPK